MVTITNDVVHMHLERATLVVIRPYPPKPRHPKLVQAGPSWRERFFITHPATRAALTRVSEAVARSCTAQASAKRADCTSDLLVHAWLGKKVVLELGHDLGELEGAQLVEEKER